MAEREKGQWDVYYNSLKSFIITFLIRWLNNLQWILIGWFIKFSVPTFQALILITRRGNLLYHDWGCTSIYRPLTYPFRSQKASRQKLCDQSIGCLVDVLGELSNTFSLNKRCTKKYKETKIKEPKKNKFGRTNEHLH